MTKKRKQTHSFWLDEEETKTLETRINESQKTKSDFLRELVLNALSLNSHLASSEFLSPIPTSKGSEEEQQGSPQETQSVKEQAECLSRFEHEGEYYCVNRKAHAEKLATLKICSKCQWRITQERAEAKGILLRTRYYAICGAKETIDKKKGLMLYCSKHFQGQWVTPKDCQTAKCLDLKEVKGQW